MRSHVTLATILVGVAVNLAYAEEPVSFADAALKAAIEEALWISDPTPTDMLGLTYLSCSWKDISDLEGLEYAANLQTLCLSHNDISDISALSGLSNLRDLNLNNNEISDFSALSGLMALESLDIHHNQPSSISFLSGLGNMRSLTLRHNRISDISPLSGLSNLQRLDVFDNQIADVSPLLGLTSLEYVDMQNNPLDEEAYRSHLQAVFKGNDGVNLNYDPNPSPPRSLAASDGAYRDKVQVTWAEVHDDPAYARYYRVYRTGPDDDAKVPISPWQTSPSFEDVTAEPTVEYTYWVQRATSSHGADATDYSGSDRGWRSSDPALAISSTPGGSVTSPAEGTLACGMNEIVQVKAEPCDPSLYVFAGWTGTAVEALRVADPCRAHTEVTVDGSYTLKAHFLTLLDTVYVDDDAPQDPGPGNPQVSDPQENGTWTHPFDTVQEAIDVTDTGLSILVRPGTYRENITLRGRSIRLTGLDGSDPSQTSYPVLDGAGQGPVVSFTGGEDPNCLLAGFVVTGGLGTQAGAIRCSHCSPTIANCLIVGNRATDPNGAAIYCADSDPLFTNCTIADNHGGQQGGGCYIVDSHLVLVNSIVWGNAPGEIVARGKTESSISFTNVAGGAPGPGNLNADPLFARHGCWVDPDDLSVVVDGDTARAIWMPGDYHLQSQVGRWDPIARAWVPDGVTSPCIDSGDPLDPVGDEPAPNGGIINMGAYGGSAGASRN